MNLQRINRNSSRQSGFTLVEVLVGIALTGILSIGITAAIAQIFIVNASSVSRMTAIKEVENAIDSMRVDVQMAQNISRGADQGFPLTLSWIDWDNNKFEVTYTLVSGELQRTQMTNNDAAKAATKSLGNNIASIELNTPQGTNNLNVTITSLAGDYRTASETRIFEILPRPGS